MAVGLCHDGDALGFQAWRVGRQLNLARFGGRLDDCQAGAVVSLPLGRLVVLVAQRIAIVYADDPSLPLDVEGDFILRARDRSPLVVHNLNGEVGHVAAVGGD